ncbi:hypothetical protein PG994_007120 [Apiospora phragmitis]|uniref:Uncharacterized protein n=1 Tax=Apiospora phragmitis TaxID=2905665 RepID=A0ABR1UZY5_9PEZI
MGTAPPPPPCSSPWPRLPPLAVTCRGSGFEGWVITANSVGDIPGTCGGLWDNLKRFADCVGVSGSWCGGTNGHLEWRFTVPDTCNKGMLSSTWWEATRNQYGALAC